MLNKTFADAKMYREGRGKADAVKLAQDAPKAFELIELADGAGELGWNVLHQAGIHSVRRIDLWRRL